MESIGCVVEIPLALKEQITTEGIFFMRRIGSEEKTESYSLAFLIGLIDCGRLLVLPETGLLEQEERRKWTNLKAFLGYSHQALLNHHNYRHFREIPALLQKVADAVVTPQFFECLEGQDTAYKLESISNNCWSNGFDVVCREGQLFNLYPSYEKPVWAPLCCGCPSVRPQDPSRIPSNICTHHSNEELCDAVLSLKPVPCELQIESRVLTNPVLEKCSKCRIVGLLLEVAGFCPKGCRLCYGCASEIYRYPCFPCPSCSLACLPQKLDLLSKAILCGSEACKALSTRMGVPMNEFPTCKHCGKVYSRHILALFGSVHSACNLCEECFTTCVSTKSPCLICKERFEKREKELLRQMTPSVCSVCFAAHVCQPACALCDFRRVLGEHFGLTFCSVCRARLGKNEPYTTELDCDKCLRKLPFAYFPPRIFCRNHLICMECAHTELEAKQGSNCCLLCSAPPPETILLCENCGKQPVSLNIHRLESDQCRICWVCASSSTENPLYCSRCNAFLQDFLIDHQLFKAGSYCHVCCSLRYPLYCCPQCQQSSCYYCLCVSDEGVGCPRCEVQVSSEEMFIQRVRTLQQRCSLCYDYKEQAVLQACGHFFHSACLQTVPRCPFHSS